MKTQNQWLARSQNTGEKRCEGGYSLIELMMVMVITGILVTFVVFNLGANRKLYKSEDQALKVVDMLQIARHRALNERETMRVEINLTDNRVRLIDENQIDSADDDQIVREIVLNDISELRYDVPPANITSTPPNMTGLDASFITSVHPKSTNDKVVTLRFRLNGTVYNAGTNPVGKDAALTSTTLYIWPTDAKQPGSAEDANLVRAVTVQGTSGLVRLWNYEKPAEPLGSGKWIDSRGRRGANSNANS